MPGKKMMYSRKFFMFNVIFVSVLAGFIISFIAFSWFSGFRAPDDIYALDNTASGSIESVDLSAGFREVAAAILPSVVQVNVAEYSTGADLDDFNFPFNNPFSFPDDNNERQFRNEGLGSGVIIRKSGRDIYVLTNAHVIGDADEISVILQDQEEIDAELVGKDERSDLAIIKFRSDNTDIRVAVLGDSDELFVGDWVLAIGHPFGYFSSVSAGIVSAQGRSGPTENINEFIQTDAAINQGNSGGALVNTSGEVVGINTWIATPTGTYIGLGFSIPINSAKRVIDDLISYGEVEYGWLGVSHREIYDEYKSEIDVSGKKGVFVSSVFFGSPAYIGGIRAGDFITSVNGRTVSDTDDLARFVGNLKPQEKAEFTLIRFGKEKKVTVTIGRRSDLLAENRIDRWPGVFVYALSEDIIDDLGIEGYDYGVIVAEIDDKTILQLSGLEEGDLIIRIDNRKISGITDFYRNISERKSGTFKMTVIRENEEIVLDVEMP